MKKKTKSFTKLKIKEKKKNSKPTSSTNINSLNNYNDIPNNQKELIRTKGRFITNHEQIKSNISTKKIKFPKNIKLNSDNLVETDEIKKAKEREGIDENQFIFNENTNSIQIERINNGPISNNNIYKNEKILLKIKKLQENYEKKIVKDDVEIKNLLDRNDKLEELVLKLKETLDRANEMFPDFLEQLVNTKEEKERESNRTALTFIEKKNEEEKMKEEINILKKKIDVFEQENIFLKKENNKLKNEFNTKIDFIIKEIENKHSKKEEIYNIKLKEFNNELNMKKIELENSINQINKFKEDNRQNAFQITSLTEEIQQKDEEINILKNKLNANEKNLKDEKKNELLINDLKSELEELIVENNE